MSSEQTADEVQASHLNAFGPQIGPIFHALYNDLVWLNAKWNEYKKLFGKSPERVQLLNDSAAFFFRVIQDALWDNIVLHIARLTDPPKQGSFENLSIRQIHEIVTKSGDNNFPDLDRAMRTAIDMARFAQVRRNKVLAHSDLANVLNKGVTSLPGISRKDVDQSIKAFNELLNYMHAERLGGEVAFEYYITHSDADLLVHYLNVARHYEEGKRARLRSGNALPIDHERPPVI